MAPTQFLFSPSSLPLLHALLPPSPAMPERAQVGGGKPLRLSPSHFPLSYTPHPFFGSTQRRTKKRCGRKPATFKKCRPYFFKLFCFNSSIQLKVKLLLKKQSIRPPKVRILAFLSKFQACEPECGLRAIVGWQNRVRACQPTSSSPGSTTSLIVALPIASLACAQMLGALGRQGRSCRSTSLHQSQNLIRPEPTIFRLEDIPRLDEFNSFKFLIFDCRKSPRRRGLFLQKAGNLNSKFCSFSLVIYLYENWGFKIQIPSSISYLRTLYIFFYSKMKCL